MHVESLLSELLISLLKKYERIELGGFAVFKLEYEEARMNEELNVLFPPSDRITIVVRGENEVDFMSVAIQEGLITDEDRENLSKCIQNKKIELALNRRTSIDGLGIISYQSGILNLSEGQHINSFSPSLSAVKIEEIQAVEMTEKEENGEAGKDVTNKDELNFEDVDSENDIAPVTSAETSITEIPDPVESHSASGKVHLDESNNPEDAELKGVLSVPEIDTAESVVEPFSGHSRVKAEKVEVIPSLREGTYSRKGERILTKEKNNEWMSYLLPLILLIFGVGLMVILFKYCSRPLGPAPRDEGSSMIIDKEREDAALPGTQEKSPIFDSPHLNKYRNLITQDIINNGCQIVVGSFSSEANALELLNRINTDKYICSLTHFDGGTRVLVTFDCAEHDLVDYLVEIRSEISPEAWFYQPKFDPEL